MLLKEALQLYQGHQVKVGADMSFFYCEICDENIFETIDKISDERYAYILTRLAFFTDKHTNFPTYWENKFKRNLEVFKNGLVKQMREKYPHKPDHQLAVLVERHFKYEINEEIEKLNERKDKELNHIKRMIKRYTDYLTNWQPYLEREVLEVYDSIVYDCRIIKITGPECGKYWDREEYNNDTTRQY